MNSFCILFNILIVFHLITGQNEENRNKLSMTLPKVAVPTHYNLFLKFIAVPENTFDGVIEISLNVIQETSSLYLNCKNLELDVENVTVNSIPALDVTVDDKIETCKIDVSEKLLVGDECVLIVPFSGIINNETNGIWQEYYTEDYVKAWYFMTTHLFPSYARSVFPCLDEPEYKAKITLTVEHDFELNVASNTQIATRVPGIPRRTIFKTTSEPIPTYAFGLVAYQNMATIYNGSIQLTYSKRQGIGETVVGTIRVFEEIYTEFFGNYVQTKFDFIAAPFSVPNGRMDAWGLHIVNQDDIFQYPLISPPKNYQVSLHNIAYMLGLNWLEYGPTPIAFNEFWISRGLIRYFEYYLPSKNFLMKFFMDFNQFVIYNTHEALLLDENLEALPINQIYTENDANQAEDYRMYEKSAALFNMFKNVMGAKSFEKAIKEYVKTFASSSINSIKLIEILEKHTKVELPTKFSIIVQNWISEVGYPIVRVFRTDTNIILTQEHYRPGNEESDTLFYIPINYATINGVLDFENTSITNWLTPEDKKIELPNERNDLYILNKQQTGFYRVLYDNSSYEYIIELLCRNHTLIHELNRIQLMDDLVSFTKHGECSYNILLNLLTYLENEESYLVWTVGNKILNGVFHILRGSAAFDRYETFVRIITKKHFDQVGGLTSVKKLHFDRLDREAIAQIACFSGVDTCIEEAQKMTNMILSGQIPPLVNTETIPIIVCTVLRHNYTIVDQLLDLLITPKMKSVETKTYNSQNGYNLTEIVFEKIGCTRNESSLQNILDLSIIPGKQIRFGRKIRRNMFQSVTKESYIGTKMGLQFMKENYFAMNQRYDNLTSLFENLNGLLMTEELCDILSDIITTYGAKFYPPSVKYAALNLLQSSQKSLIFTQKYVPVITAWLADNEYNGTEAPENNGSSKLLSEFTLIIFIITITLYNFNFNKD